MTLDQLIPQKMEGKSDMAAGWNNAIEAIALTVKMVQKFGYVLVLNDDGQEAQG